jgi:DNA uptake protein ComE-like DNA-binding protein
MFPTSLLHSVPSALPSLTLSGVNGYDIHGDRVVLSASEIANHRDSENISGSLSLELWALNRPYVDGYFEGVALAGTEIGRVSGQHVLVNGQYELPFTEPAPGQWHLTLMLREWEGNGFVTRDHIQFAQPYVVEAPAVETPVLTQAPVIAAAVAEEVAPASVQAEPAPALAAAKAAPVAKAAPAVVDRRVSINGASRADLAAIKGVSKKLADAIVAARPIVSVDALLAVKGMGPKLLDKLRSSVRL